MNGSRLHAFRPPRLMVRLPRGVRLGESRCGQAIRFAWKACPMAARQLPSITSRFCRARIDMRISRLGWLRFAICAAPITTALWAQQPLYQNPDAPVEKRVDDLLFRMTLEEKVSQLMSDSPAIDRL